ncbi:MAG: ABC transporter permease subunit [Candidatus Thermoplasmatota archaeon]|nr:ABC transporter permease subunit [Candidatus Thermoplasmatota archaeon]
MRNRLQTVWELSIHDTKRHIRSQRMLILAPLVIFLLCAACWGFADSRIAPAGLTVNSPADVLFLSSTSVVFICTLSVVLLGFDAVSRRRLTGEWAMDLSQPMPRSDYALSQLMGVWMAAMIPTTIGILVGTFLIKQQMGQWPALDDLTMFLFATGLLLWWYTSLQLLASSLARDVGASVTLGVGTWLFFVFLWLIPTLIIAQSMGVDVTDTTSIAFDQIQEKTDLFSPNGVYQLLMETRLNEDSQPHLSPTWIWISAISWFAIPTFAFSKRIEYMRP